MRECGLPAGPGEGLTGLAGSLLDLTLKALPSRLAPQIDASAQSFGEAPVLEGREGGRRPPLFMVAGECLAAMCQLQEAVSAVVRARVGQPTASPFPSLLRVLGPKVLPPTPLFAPF
jgi:hypothetical protein